MVAIGTWNLENLFRPGEDGPSGRDEYDAKLDALAQTITALGPDVLAVQEVGDPEALNDLVRRVEGGWHTALAAPDARGIRVGILSRQRLSDVEQVTDFPEHLTRCRSTTPAPPSTSSDAPACAPASRSTAQAST